MIIYKYFIYIFYMNMRSGSHALLHVEKSEKMRFWQLHKYVMWESEKMWRIKYYPTQVIRTLNHFNWSSSCWDIGVRKGLVLGRSKMRFWQFCKYFMWELEKDIVPAYSSIQSLNYLNWSSGCWDVGVRKGLVSSSTPKQASFLCIYLNNCYSN